MPGGHAYNLLVGHQNFKQGDKQVPKILILRLISGGQTSKFPARSALLKQKRKMFAWNKQALVEIRFRDFWSTAVQLKFLVENGIK